MSNVICVVAINLIDERNYEFEIARDEIEMILNVK